MCDTFVILPSVTKGKTVILGKSADCRVNEAHSLVRIPKEKHLPGEVVRTTHIVIPQVKETFEIILSKSFWTWGGEIGINEFGVAIGNEAVFTNVMNDEKVDGLITMDLLRLGLERAKTSREAVEVMGELVHRYGQGGNCELPGNSHWDSSYLISDKQEAWILETAGREWAAKKVGPVASISNAFVIKRDWDLCSLEEQYPDLDWETNFSDMEPVPAIGSVERRQTTCGFLEAEGKDIGIRSAFDLLRNHDEDYHPATAKIHAICMHAGPGDMRLWNACGAMASEVSHDGLIGWFTGTSGTCTSIFKPVFLGIELPDMGPSPTERFDPKAMWWIGELLHRRAIADFSNVVPEIRAEFEALEDEFLAEAYTVLKGNRKQKKEFMDECFHKSHQATRQWVDCMTSRKNLLFEDEAYRAAWEVFNREAGLADMPA
jgi:dipeptidase